ncbi:MAG: NAD-dependent epimerase/dehydratase family protein [Desulfurivibrio sp.]|nr:NAD-dependent epimerase/dehydratase family protein [Desulfurivibrio sp.]
MTLTWRRSPGCHRSCGAALVAVLEAGDCRVRPLGRRGDGGVTAVGEIGPQTNWTTALAGVRVLFHAAALKQPQGRAVDGMAALRRVNVAGSRRLAEQAAAARVRRLVFVSSLKVLGERTAPGAPLTAAAAPKTRRMLTPAVNGKPSRPSGGG